ncbi:MAG: phage terminase large subunit [Nanoarchaeota archaeon]
MDAVFINDKKPHLKTIAEILQKVYEGSIKKLMISMPPRAGKSYIVSLFCTWVIGKKEGNASIMRNAYGLELAEKFSYDIREIIKGDKYQKIFPGVRLKQDKKAVGDWATEASAQSTYFCGGVQGAITGKGCKDIAILDDPIKNLEEALSETILDKTWNWYLSTHKARMETGCPEIHIATRWSKKDPIGMLLAEQGKDWIQIKIPAIINEKSFCEEIRTTEEYLETRSMVDSSIWEAEYMQEPVETKGLLFPMEDLTYFRLKELRGEEVVGVMGYADLADEGDDSFCCVIGYIYNDLVYVVDVVFTKEPIEVTEAEITQQIIDYKPDVQYFESNFGGKSFAKTIKRNIDEHNNTAEKTEDKVTTIIKWKANTVNKETRILMKSGVIKQRFRFLEKEDRTNAYEKFIQELTSYIKQGKNKHDDAADGLTGLAERVYIKKVEFLR